MKEQLSVSNARATFLKLLREIQKDPLIEYEITNRDQVVAVIRSPEPFGVKYGAGRALLDVVSKVPSPRTKKKVNVSSHKNKYLYGHAGAVR